MYALVLLKQTYSLPPKHMISKTFEYELNIQLCFPSNLLILIENIYPDGMIPLTGKTMGDPREVAQAILYLSQASYVTGSELYVDGGQSTVV